MNKLDRFCSLDRVEVEKLIVNFNELLGLLNKFRIDSKPLGDMLKAKITSFTTSSGDKVKLCYESGAEYFCNSNIIDIFELAIAVLSTEKLLVCIDDLEDTLFKYLKDTIPSVFENSDSIPEFYETTLVIPSEFSESDCEEYLSKVLWGRINKLIVPGNVKLNSVLSYIQNNNMVIHCKETFVQLTDSMKKELDSVQKDCVFNFSEVFDEYKDRLENLQSVFSELSQQDKTSRLTGPSSLNVVSGRYDLIVKMYHTLSIKASGVTHLLVSVNTTNPFVLEIIGSICATYSYFNNVKIIVDEKHAIYPKIVSMIQDISRGDMLSPYVSLQRINNIRKDVDLLNDSMLRGVLRNGDRRNPVVSLPLKITNDAPCYLFPLNMFIAYSGDKKMSSESSQGRYKILTLPQQKVIDIHIKECTLDNIPEYEGVKLVLPDDYTSKESLFNSNMIEHLQYELKDTLVNDEKFRKSYASIILEYLKKGDIGFEGSGAKLELHDWILNPSLKALDVIKDYLPVAMDSPNWDSSLDNREFGNLYHKILGFQNEEEYRYLYKPGDWDDTEVADSSVQDGIVVSRGTFKSLNYEKEEFYASVCEMITSILVNESDCLGNTIGYKYVSLHDLLLATMEKDGVKQVYVLYCPSNSKMLWLSTENGDLASILEESDDTLEIFSVEKDTLSGISDSLLNFSDVREMASYVGHNIDNLLDFDTKDFNSLELEVDKHRVLDVKFNIQESEIYELSYSEDDSGESEEKLKQKVLNICKANNVLDVSYIPSEYRDLYCKTCLWNISTRFIGFPSNIPEVFSFEEESGIVNTSDYGITILQYLYSDNYNVIGYQNLEELATIVSPEKHLKFARVINPFGGIMRDGNLLSLPNKSKLFCTTGEPGSANLYQYINSRFISKG